MAVSAICLAALFLVFDLMVLLGAFRLFKRHIRCIVACAPGC